MPTNAIMITIVEEGAEKVGGLGKLADGLGITHQAFYSWKKVPAERVLDFERLTGISRYVQRPDIYGVEPAPVPQDVPHVQPAGPDGTPASGPALCREAAE